MGISLKSNRMQRDKMVDGSLWTSVVARMNTACFGGSSSVFKSALKASVVSIWTSSIIYTLYFPLTGGYWIFSRISLTFSTLLLEAASISRMSRLAESAKALQTSHFPHGEPFTGDKQFIARAKIFAADVLPVPLAPQNRYA